MNFLLLPGLDGTGRLFEPFTNLAPPDAMCIVASYPPDRELSYPECVAHIASSFLPEDPFVIVAESFSGPVAVLLAADRPARLRGIVLCNTFASSAGWPGFRHLPWTMLFGLHLSRLSIGLLLTGFRAASVLTDAIRSANAAVEPRVRAARMRAALTVDVRGELATLKTPVMYLRGMHDRLVLGHCLRRVVAARPETTVCRVPGPHLLLQTEPKRSWREIVRFVHTQCS